jgi:hypothetical protein
LIPESPPYIESIEVIIADTLVEACVYFKKVDVPLAFTLLFINVKIVIVKFEYCMLNAASRSLLIVKEKALAVTVVAGWIYICAANPNTKHLLLAAKLHKA